MLRYGKKNGRNRADLLKVAHYAIMALHINSNQSGEIMMMQISDDTIEVLKNFGTISASMSFKAGNTVRTVSEQKNILAQAEIGETLPVNFAIYELNQF